MFHICTIYTVNLEPPMFLADMNCIFSSVTHIVPCLKCTGTWIHIIQFISDHIGSFHKTIGLKDEPVFKLLLTVHKSNQIKRICTWWCEISLMEWKTKKGWNVTWWGWSGVIYMKWMLDIFYITSSSSNADISFYKWYNLLQLCYYLAPQFRSITAAG